MGRSQGRVAGRGRMGMAAYVNVLMALGRGRTMPSAPLALLCRTLDPDMLRAHLSNCPISTIWR